MRISKTGSNPSAQHALGSGPQPPGHEPVPGSEITKCILVVTPLTFLGMRVVDSSHGNTAARVLPDRGKIAKRWPVRGY